MAEQSLEYERKELNKAQNLGIFGLIGAFLPLIGFMLGLISLATAISIKPTHEQTQTKRTSVLIIAVLAILLSVGAAIGYYVLYNQRQADVQRQEEQTQQAKDRVEEEKRLHEEAVQNTLNFCLNQAEKRYQDSWNEESRALGRSDGRLPESNAERLDSFYREWKDDCYKAAQAGDTSHPLDL